MRTFLVVEDRSLAVVGRIEARSELAAWRKVVERTQPPYQPDGRVTCWPAESREDIEWVRALRRREVVDR